MHALQVLLKKQLTAAWRYRWPAVLVSWLVCAAGWGFVFTIPNQFESSARMYVDADVVLTPLLRGITVDSSLPSQVDLLQRTLLSRPNLDRLISKTDLELQLQNPTDRQALIERLGTEIRIAPQTRNLFTISYRNASPRLAYDVVQSMLAQFVESKAGNNRTDLENAGRFLQEQITSYERQLREAEQRRADFKTRFADVLPGPDGGLSKLDQAIAAVRTLEGQLQDARARRSAMAKELATTPQTIVTESDASGAGPGGVTRLQAAERNLGELRLKYTESHPEVVAARNLLAAIRSGRVGPDGGGGTAASPTRSKSASNPVYEGLRARILENDGTILSLERQSAEALRERDRLQEIVRGAPALQADSVNLNRDYEVLRKNYDDLIGRRESMRISSAAETGADKVKVQVIDPPQIPQTPVAPKRVLLVTAVLGAGLAAGAALALLLVQLDQSFRSTEDLRDLGYPVVGGVSMMADAVPLSHRLLAIGSFAAALAVPAVVYGGLMIRLLGLGLRA